VVVGKVIDGVYFLMAIGIISGRAKQRVDSRLWGDKRNIK